MSRLARAGAAFDDGERRRLRGLGAAVGGLHLLGWGLIARYAPAHPVLGGLAVLAYSFGLRHAFDADHIAAIDNTTRKLLGEGGRPLATGFFFSLGHSTVVLTLCVGLVLATGAVHSALPALQTSGSDIGAAVSGAFLLAIGFLNLVVLLGILGIRREMRDGRYSEQQLEARLRERGLMARFFARPLRLVRSSPQMYPVGFLFGLGFDTASEIGLLTVTAGVAGAHVPLPGVLALPALFAAGMSLMDTADGVVMTKAYDWAFSTPVRKIYYNIAVTALSVTVALLIGTIEFAQVLSHRLGWDGALWTGLRGLDFSTMGYLIVGLFLVAWLAAAAIWRWRHIEERWTSASPSFAKLATPEKGGGPSLSDSSCGTLEVSGR